jgi:predicted RNase H-like HicB family nuclease
MLYPVYVHPGDAKHAHGVTFPDFTGCFSAVDKWSDLPAAVQEAVEAHFNGEPDAVPAPTPLENLVNQAEYAGGVWMLVELDLSRIDSQPVRLNVSLPSHLVQQIDAWAKAHHMTRSGFLASAATQAMATRS